MALDCREAIRHTLENVKSFSVLRLKMFQKIKKWQKYIGLLQLWKNLSHIARSRPNEIRRLLSVFKRNHRQPNVALNVVLITLMLK